VAAGERAAMYDVLVVGARCAGAPTAMLLARLGYRVLLVDRASFPSDTLSTHFIKPPVWPCSGGGSFWTRSPPAAARR
jgi:glycine/D-amino acid oxidase-like deaminating enzyme